MPHVLTALSRHRPRSGTSADAQPAVDHLARGGLIAYGTVHLLIGWLAIELAVGGGGKQADNQGAMRELAGTPVGRPLLWLIVIGLVALVLWRLSEAAVGHRRERSERTRLGKRLVSLGLAAAYGVLAASAAKVAAAGGGGSSPDSSGEEFSARLMSAPAGQFLVGLAGCAIASGGIWMIYRGVTERFREQLDAEGERGKTGTVVLRVGKIGHAGKGAAYAVLGALFVIAAIDHDPKRAGGLDDALKTLLGQPAGPVLVALLGLGFAAYGLYCFARARHLRPNPRGA